MEILRDRYAVLSRGEDSPEPVPMVEKSYSLRLKKHDQDEVVEGQVTVGFAYFEGLYVLVMGKLLISGVSGEVTANYITDASEPEDKVIGDLVVKHSQS